MVFSKTIEVPCFVRSNEPMVDKERPVVLVRTAWAQGWHENGGAVDRGSW